MLRWIFPCLNETADGGRDQGICALICQILQQQGHLLNQKLLSLEVRGKIIGES